MYHSSYILIQRDHNTQQVMNTPVVDVGFGIALVVADVAAAVAVVAAETSTAGQDGTANAGFAPWEKCHKFLEYMMVIDPPLKQAYDFTCIW